MRGRIALRRLVALGTGLAPVVAMHVRVMQALRDGDPRRAVADLTLILQSVAAVFATE